MHVLGDRLGTLRDGVLGQLTGQDEADRSLDLAGGDGGLLGVGREFFNFHLSQYKCGEHPQFNGKLTRRFSSNSLKNIVNK